jgi:hypothetical protein
LASPLLMVTLAGLMTLWVWLLSSLFFGKPALPSALAARLLMTLLSSVLPLPALMPMLVALASVCWWLSRSW